MSVERSRKERTSYHEYLKKQTFNNCDFCAVKKGDNNFVSKTKNFKEIKNLFPYSIWDSHKVIDHLMVVPKEHKESLENFSQTEAMEYLKLVSNYESIGYNIYARSTDSKTRSITHQHTHLIKTSDKRPKFIMIIKWPFYFRIPT